MTVPSETNRSGPYNGNGSTTVFGYGFRIIDEDHLRVIKTSALSVETTLTIDTDYIVSDVGEPAGGQVALTVAPSTGETVTILRNIPFVQETDLENQGAYYAETVEDALDLAAMRDQQIVEELGRAIRIPASSAPDTDLQLPAPEAGMLISWNEVGDGLTNLSPTDLVSVASYGTARADIFTGDGAQTAFALSANPAALNNLDVSIGGVTQLPGVDYLWSGGTTVTLTSAPANGVKVLFRYMQGLPFGVADAASVTLLDGRSVQVAIDALDALKTVFDGEEFRVETYRHSGDTDDQAWQRAVNAAVAAGGGVVRGDDINYTFANRVNITGNGVHIRGAGRMATVVAGSSTSIDLFKFNGYRCSIGELSLATFRTAVQFEKSTFCLAYDIYCTTGQKCFQINGDYTGATKLDCIQISISEVEMEAFTVAGIHTYQCGDVFVDRARTSGSNTAAVGLLIDSATTAVYVSQSNILSCYEGLRIIDNVGVSPNPFGVVTRPGQMMFSMCLFDTCANRGANLANAYQVKFSNCWFGGAQTNEGCYVNTTSTEIEFDGCHYLGNAKDGLRIAGPNAAAHVSVIGGHAYGNGFLTTNTYDGVCIEGGVEHFSIIGMKAYNDTAMGLAAKQRFGIYLFSGASNNYIIVANQFSGNLSGAYQDNGTGTTKHVALNQGDTPVATALKGSATYNPGSLTDGSINVTTVTVTGAVVGDVAVASHSAIVGAGWLLSAAVTSADTVAVTMLNKTGGTVDLPSGTLKAIVFK